MDFPENAATTTLVLENPRTPGESDMSWSKRLSLVSGGAVSPSAMRAKIRRMTKSGKTQKTPVPVSVKKRPAKRVDPSDKVIIDEKKNDMVWQYDGNANITNLEEALVFSKVDLNIWEVERHVFNTWTTTSKDAQKWNLQIKLWFKRRQDHGVNWDDVMKDTVAAIMKTKPANVRGSGIGFITTADFHFGAYVDDLIRSDKFNIDVLSKYLSQAADIINSHKYEEVYVSMLGDFIESFTGLNHVNSWKGLGKGMYGMNAVILCSEILVSAFLGRINNLAWVGMVSGNHCRVTSEKEGDQKGEVGTMIHYLLSKSLTVDVDYHPMVLAKEVDGVYYVMTHGHLPISKREPAKILFDYGKQGMFNVLLSGHTHSRTTKKSSKSTTMTWNEATVVSMDEVDYRVLVAPPMFTGNFFSESLGYSSSAGFLAIQSNGRGRINVFDYCL